MLFLFFPLTHFSALWGQGSCVSCPYVLTCRHSWYLMCLMYVLKLSYSLVSWTPNPSSSPPNSLILPFIFLGWFLFLCSVLWWSLHSFFFLLFLLFMLPLVLLPDSTASPTPYKQGFPQSIYVLTWSHPSTQPLARHLYMDGSCESHSKSTSKTKHIPHCHVKALF